LVIGIDMLPHATAARLAGAVDPLLEPPALPQLLHYRQQGLVLQVQLEDRPHPRGLGVFDHQAVALGIDVVAEDGVAASPLTLSLRGGDLVASFRR
jgi:hypothetical protein